MKKRIITLTLALVMLMPLMTPAVYAEDLLESKAVYYTEESDYIDGDCILTATRMMIRRASIMRNKTDWSTITNASLRPQATTDGLLLYSFCYDSGETEYSITSSHFTGEGSQARIAEFERLLEEHPEGPHRPVRIPAPPVPEKHPVPQRQPVKAKTRSRFTVPAAARN